MYKMQAKSKRVTWVFLLLQVWVYRCIQEFQFLQPRISRHPFYEKAKAALRADPSRPLLVTPSMAL